MGFILYLAFLAVGFIQIFAFIDGMYLYFGLGGFISFIIFLFFYNIPLIGPIGAGFMTYYGARYGWHWEWWQALLLAAPGIIMMIVVGLFSGIFDRRYA